MAHTCISEDKDGLCDLCHQEMDRSH
jgi:hypothetical protein